MAIIWAAPAGHVRRPGGGRRRPALLAAARTTYESVENPLVPVQFYMIVNQNAAMLAVQDPQGNVCKTTGPRPEPAMRRALTVEELSARLAKTGGTAYVCTQVKAVVEPAQLGRLLPSTACAGMCWINSPPCGAPGGDAPGQVHKAHGVLRPAGSTGPYGAGDCYGPGDKQAPGDASPVLYVPLYLLIQDRAFYTQVIRRVRLAAVLPRVIHDGELAGVTRQLDEVYDLGVRHVLLGNLGQIPLAKATGLCHLRRLWPESLQQPVHECHALFGPGQRYGVL